MFQDEIVSCYCSASHYSTDEHDSLRDSVLHHSDSGADLSESSRDLDWERYWTLHGERLIWESWISKYGSYIDPNYLSPNCNVQSPAEGDETSFCVQGDNSFDPNRRTSFGGILDSVSNDCVKQDNLNKTQSCVETVKPQEPDTPHILVEIVKTEDISNRRFSDISETATKSVSERSEDSSNVDDNDKFRLNVISRCSGSSAPLSATTDSMTNVTRMTLSSSDSSYGNDESSAKSSLILSSSDSAQSVDQQWQLLWADHFNEQYNYHYSIFNERHKKKECGEEVKSDSGFIIEDSKLAHYKQSDPLHQESIDDVGSIEEIQDSVSESDLLKPTSAPGNSKTSNKSEKLRKYSHKQR